MISNKQERSETANLPPGRWNRIYCSSAYCRVLATPIICGA